MISRVLAVTPGDHGTTRDLVWLIEAAARAGVQTVVLREPQLSERDYVTLARRLDPVATIILHGKHPAALAIAGAAGWGLHLPSGADIVQARAVVRGFLGASCHDAEQLRLAADGGCDYATLAPIFSPFSKPTTSAPLGLERMAELIAATSIPVFAQGGIDGKQISSVLRAGAYGVAVTGALFPPAAMPEDVEEAGKSILQAVLASPPRRP